MLQRLPHPLRQFFLIVLVRYTILRYPFFRFRKILKISLTVLYFLNHKKPQYVCIGAALLILFKKDYCERRRENVFLLVVIYILRELLDKVRIETVD